MIYSKKFKTQKNEVLFLTVAYNADRLVNNPKILFTFYKAVILKMYKKRFYLKKR